MTNIEIPEEANDAVRNTVAAYLAGEALEAQPFDGSMTKDEMVDHIIDVHQHYGHINGKSFGKYGTKVTKDELIRWHERQHEILDADELVLLSRYGTLQVQLAHGDRYDVAVLPTMRHTHLAVAVSEATAEAAASLRAGKKVDGVLSVTERKVLKEVVDNDFGALKQEMKAFAADTLTSVKDGINDEWDKREKSIPDFAARATQKARKFGEKADALRNKYEAERKALTDAYQDDLNKIQVEAKERGVELVADTESTYDENTGERRQRTVYKASVKGRREALEEAQRENETMLNRALMDLERQRLTAQRQVLLSGVPEGAMPILESIPDAKTLMVESAKASAQTQIEVRKDGATVGKS